MWPRSEYLIGEAGHQYIKNSIQRYFNTDVVLEEDSINFNHHGCFLLKYKYIPQSYIISSEVEFNSFSVMIENEDGGFVFLNQLTKFKNEMKAISIEKMLVKLKKSLEKTIQFQIRR